MSMSVVEQLSNLASLRASGALSDAEFAAAKQRVLTSDATPAAVTAMPVQVASATWVNTNEERMMNNGGGKGAVPVVVPITPVAHAQPMGVAYAQPAEAYAQPAQAYAQSAQGTAPAFPIPLSAATPIAFDPALAAQDGSNAGLHVEMGSMNRTLAPQVMTDGSGTIIPVKHTAMLKVEDTGHGFKVTAPLLADKSAVMWQFLPPLVLTVVCIGLGFFLNSLIWTAGVCNNTVIFDSSSSSRASSPTRYPTKYPTSTSNTNYPTPDTHSQFSTTFPTALGQVDLGNGWNVCWLTYLLALPFQIGFVFIVLPMWWSALTVLCNKIEIELDTSSDQISYTMGPIPQLPCGPCALSSFLALQKSRQMQHSSATLSLFGNKRTVKASEIVQLFIGGEVQVHTSKRRTWTTMLYKIRAVMRDGQDIEIGKITKSDGKWVERKLEDALGIVDQRVAGEMN